MLKYVTIIYPPPPPKTELFIPQKFLVKSNSKILFQILTLFIYFLNFMTSILNEKNFLTVATL